MGVKLNKETSDVIHVSQMRDGQIAEITKHMVDIHVGRICQRVGDNLFSLGLPDDNFYGKFFPSNKHTIFNVRILKNGETLTITDNE